MALSADKVGRNEKCNCSSGDKFKKCCLPVSIENENALRSVFFGASGAVPSKLVEPGLTLVPTSSSHLLTADAARSPQMIQKLFDRGVDYWQAGELEDATKLFLEVVSLDPINSPAYNNLGTIYKRQSLHEDAQKYFNLSIAIDPNQASAYFNLAGSLGVLNDRSGALEAFEKVLLLEPNNVTAGYMCAALNGGKLKCSPELYIKELFDSFATNYENSVVNDLDYSVPQILVGQLENDSDVRLGSFESALDIGCGTGLSGAAFAKYVNQFVGVDLSEQMIERASAKECYSELVVMDAFKYLTSNTVQYDLVLAADSLIYTGDLCPLFSSIGERLESNGLFFFSIELTKNSNYLLRPTGRFAHSVTYIRKLCDKLAFEIVSMKEIDIRKEGGKAIRGATFMVRRG